MIFIGAIFSLVLLVLVSFRFKLLPIFVNSSWQSFLISDTTANVISSILASIVAAYLFYCVIDLYPRKKRIKSILKVLNLLVLSIVDTLKTGSPMGHELSITSININDYSIDEINSLINRVKHLDEKKRYDQGKLCHSNIYYAMQAADSRLYDFENALSIAVIHSPEAALKWLVLTDKVRLMKETYQSFPDQDPMIASIESFGCSEKQNTDSVSVLSYENITFQAYQIRMLEYLEESKKWFEELND